MLVLVLSVCTCLLTVHAQDIVRDEGDICTQRGHVQSACKKLRECPEALQDLKEGRRPTTCGFLGSESLVCCTLSSTLQTSSGPQGSPKPLASSTPLPTSIPLTNSKPVVSSHPVASSKPIVSSHPLESSKPTVSSHSLANSKPTVSLHPLASSKPTASSHPIASSKPTVSSHPLASSKPTVSSHPLASSKPTVSSHPLTSSKPIVSSHQLANSKPPARPKPQENGKGRSKSKQKCEEYAESVRIKATNQNSDEVTVETCGVKDSPLLVGGFNPARPRAYPHMALIGYGDKNIRWLCGGTLISERFVLSAAHCAEAGRRGVARWARVGDYDIASKKDDDSGFAKSRMYEITEIITHPEYKRSKYNDIGLYKLVTDVQFNEFIRPICLQTEHHVADASVIYSAWGETSSDGSNVLKESNLVIIGGKECNESYKEDAFRKILFKGIDGSSMLCASRKDENDSCRERDTEGPLHIRLRQPYCMYSQVGIVSVDRRCASNFPSIFTRVSHYVPWIESIVWP